MNLLDHRNLLHLRTKHSLTYSDECHLGGFSVTYSILTANNTALKRYSQKTSRHILNALLLLQLTARLRRIQPRLHPARNQRTPGQVALDRGLSRQ